MEQSRSGEDGSLGYANDSRWRNGSEFVNGRDEIVAPSPYDSRQKREMSIYFTGGITVYPRRQHFYRPAEESAVSISPFNQPS